MSDKLLLFLSADYFYAYRWVKGEMESAQHFTDNAEGREQFIAFLKTQHAPTYLLTDFIEEDFRHETVPHLRGRERSALIQRKFEQYYRNTPFRQALSLQRNEEGRRDEVILFSALTNPGHIMPWLTIMLAQGVPLAGIYSVPNISAPLVKDIHSDHLLLLSWEKHAGLRETYFSQKRLHFSRLVSINPSKSFGEVVAIETARTQHYLHSLSLLPHNQTLDVLIICHVNEQRELEAHLHNTSVTHYAYLDIQALGKQLNSTASYVDSDATPLFLHLLAAKPPSSHYAAPEHVHFFKLWHLRRGLLALSAMLMLTSVLWGVADILEGRGLNTESESIKQEAAQIAQQAQQIEQQFRDTPGFAGTQTSATDMKTAVLLMRKLDHYTPPPQEVLADLSITLNAFPKIQIDKLAWKINTEPTNPNVLEHVILVDGELQEWSINYRGGLNYLERFQQALIKQGHQVMALTLPLDVSASGSIALSTNDTKPAQFALKIIWQPK